MHLTSIPVVESFNISDGCRRKKVQIRQNHESLSLHDGSYFVDNKPEVGFMNSSKHA